LTKETFISRLHLLLDVNKEDDLRDIERLAIEYETDE